jgi:hypothetical protein
MAEIDYETRDLLDLAMDDDLQWIINTTDKIHSRSPSPAKIPTPALSQQQQSPLIPSVVKFTPIHEESQHQPSASLSYTNGAVNMKVPVIEVPASQSRSNSLPGITNNQDSVSPVAADKNISEDSFGIRINEELYDQSSAPFEAVTRDQNGEGVGGSGSGDDSPVGAERKKSKKSKQYYSWAGPRRSLSRSSRKSRSSSRAASQDQQQQQDQQQPQDMQKPFQSQQKSLAELQQKQSEEFIKILLSKSLPALSKLTHGQAANSVPNTNNNAIFSSSLAAGDNQSKSTIDKRSIKGLTKNVFDNASTVSPYLDHLRNPNPLANLHGASLQKAVFRMNGKQKRPSRLFQQDMRNEIPLPNMQPIPARKSTVEGSYEALKKEVSKIPKELELRPFTPITVKQFASQGIHAIRSDMQPKDLFLHSKALLSQIEQHSRHPSAEKRPNIGPMREEETQRSSPSDHFNTISSRPISSKLIRATSPSTMRSLFTGNIAGGTAAVATKNNDIDKLVSEQVLPHFQPAVLSPNAMLSDLYINQSQPKDDEDGTGNHQRIDLMDILANIHTDPLYRIIKEEMDRIQQTSTGSIDGKTALAYKQSDPIIPSHIKILSYFQSLPPAVWVTCRLVYFLIVSYYEVVIRPAKYQIFREFTQMEALWSILQRHCDEHKMSIETSAKLFSWTYLRELLVHPAQFVKLLDLIENGLKLSHANWDSFRSIIQEQHEAEEIRKFTQSNSEFPSQIPSLNPPQRRSLSPDLPNNSVAETFRFEIPMISVIDEESSRQLFFELFPPNGFQSLRDMVKAARGFLLSSSSSLFQGQGYGAPMVPGTPLAISMALTAWVKRIIALLYISGTKRVRMIKSAQTLSTWNLPSPFEKNATLNNSISTFSMEGNLPSPYLLQASLYSPVDHSHQHQASNMLRPRSQNHSNSLSLPPNLSFAFLINLKIPGYNVIQQQMKQQVHPYQILLDPIVRQEYLQCFYIAASLVKPADAFEVRVHGTPNDALSKIDDLTATQSQDRNASQEKYLESMYLTQQLDILRQEYETFLRNFTSSPLHNVQLFHYYDEYLNLRALYQQHPWLTAVHPGLALKIGNDSNANLAININENINSKNVSLNLNSPSNIDLLVAPFQYMKKVYQENSSQTQSSNPYYLNPTDQQSASKAAAIENLYETANVEDQAIDRWILPESLMGNPSYISIIK